LETGAQTIGYVFATPDQDPLAKVPEEFQEYLDLMGKAVADALPEHKEYDCKI